MIDDRLLGNTLAKGFIADTNKESRGDLRMSYCVPMENADLISLVISREQQFLVEGLQWGVIKIKLSLEFTDFPKQYDNLDVVAGNMIVSTTMEERITDPDIIDISVSNTARKELAKLYLAGDLVDLEEPEKNKVAKRTAKSSIRDMSKGDQQHFGEGWGDMMIPRMQASIASDELEDDDQDTASDVERRRVLIENNKRNQELVRSALKGSTNNMKGSPSAKPKIGFAEVAQVHEINDSDELNVFD
jgi:hypothetical protein